MRAVNERYPPVSDGVPRPKALLDAKSMALDTLHFRRGQRRVHRKHQRDQPGDVGTGHGRAVFPGIRVLAPRVRARVSGGQSAAGALKRWGHSLLEDSQVLLAATT